MKRTLLLVLLTLIGIGRALAQTPGEGFDATHYEIRLWDFDFTQRTLQGVSSHMSGWNSLSLALK